MTNFTVLHIRKVKTMTGCIEVLKHNHRKKENLEAFIDVDKSQFNLYKGTADDNFVAEYEKLVTNAALSRKIQRNASRAIEVVVSFSHDYGDDWEDKPELKMKIGEYFDNSERFLKERYGDVIICRADHYDEKTPHSHVLMIPLCTDKNGKLRFSSSEFLGGKKGLVDLHSKFHDQVGKHFGLARGRLGERASHSDLKAYKEWEKAQRIELEGKEKQATEHSIELQKQQAIINQNGSIIDEQRKLLFEQRGEILRRTAELANKHKELEEAEKIVSAQSQQEPQIPIPPATLFTENSRKIWRDGIQKTVQDSFRVVTTAFQSLQTKYNTLLDKFIRLTSLNETIRIRAEKAERDLAEKPIEEIILEREKVKSTESLKNTISKQGGQSR